MKPYVLLTPGPTPLPPEVLEALALPLIHHRTNECEEMFKHLLEDLQQVFRTKNTVLMMTTSGTGAMESAIVNLLSPGDKALVCSTGLFGDRFVSILKTYGIETVVLSEEWGNAADPQRLKAALNAQRDVKVVYFQHTDTSTGIVNDVETLSRVIRENSDALVVVDSISGLAAERLETDVWGVDVAIAASQKGLMNAPGLSFLAISGRAWNLVNQAKLPRFYFDWRTMKDFLVHKATPYTPAICLIVAQAVALQLILKIGLEKIWQRTASLAEYTRTETDKMGFKLFAKNPSNILTAIWLPDGVDGTMLVRRIQQEERVCLGVGLGKLGGKVIRIAHMGYISRQDVDNGLAAIARRLPTVIKP